VKKKAYISLGIVSFLLVSILFSVGKVSTNSEINNPKIGAITGSGPAVLKPIIPSPNTDGIVNLRWDLVPGVVAYSIHKIDPNGVSTRLVRNFRGNSYKISGLTSGVWKFQLRNIYWADFGEWSNIETVEVIINGVRNAPAVDTPSNPIPTEIIIGSVIIGAILIGILIWIKKRNS